MSDINIDHQDLLISQGAFDSEEDELRYREWLDRVMADEEYEERVVEQLMNEKEEVF